MKQRLVIIKNEAQIKSAHLYFEVQGSKYILIQKPELGHEYIELPVVAGG